MWESDHRDDEVLENAYLRDETGTVLSVFPSAFSDPGPLPKEGEPLVATLHVSPTKTKSVTLYKVFLRRTSDGETTEKKEEEDSDDTDEQEKDEGGAAETRVVYKTETFVLADVLGVSKAP